jgi:hypothetical protein
MSGIRVDQNILNQRGTPAFNAGIFATRPSAGFVGRIFISTNTYQIFRDEGTGWSLISDAGSGSSNLEQVTLNGNNTPYGINITNGGLFLLGSTDGSIFFASGGSGQFTTDNANFFWDDTNNRLGIGTATPSAKLDIHSGSGTNATFNGTGVTNAVTTYQSAGTSKWSLGNYVSSTVANDFCIYDNVNTAYRFYIHNTGVINIPSSLIIGSTTPTSSYALDVTGTSRFTALITGLSATFSSTITATGTSTFNAGSSGSITLQTNGADNNWSSAITGANTTSQSYGLIIQAGTNSTDAALRIRNRANTLDWLFVRGDGNVGIGTTSPNTILDVNGTINVRTNSFEFGRITTNNISANQGGLTFQFNQSGTFVEGFRLNASGNVLIGTTTDRSDRLQVQGDMVAQNTSGSGFFSRATSNSTTYGFYNNGGGQLILTNSGVANVGTFTMATGVYVATSDFNKKKDFEISTIGLDAILNLKPTLYRMKIENNTKKHLGFIAQEVKEFIPQAYVEQKDFIGLDFNPIVAALVKSIQELNEKLVRNNIN